MDQMQPGDVVTYYSDASHVGIYIGDGMMVHASTFGVPVRGRAGEQRADLQRPSVLIDRRTRPAPAVLAAVLVAELVAATVVLVAPPSPDAPPRTTAHGRAHAGSARRRRRPHGAPGQPRRCRAPTALLARVGGDIGDAVARRRAFWGTDWDRDIVVDRHRLRRPVRRAGRPRPEPAVDRHRRGLGRRPGRPRAPQRQRAADRVRPGRGGHERRVAANRADATSSFTSPPAPTPRWTRRAGSTEGVADFVARPAGPAAGRRRRRHRAADRRRPGHRRARTGRWATTGRGGSPGSSPTPTAPTRCAGSTSRPAVPATPTSTPRSAGRSTRTSPRPAWRAGRSWLSR